MRRVHREATECVGATRLGRNSRCKRGLAYRRTEETALCSTGHIRNRILFIGRGLACWKYALEAIIKVLLYFNVHDKCLLFML